MFSTLGLSQPRINLQGIFVSNGYKELNFWFGFCTPLWKGETTNDEWERGRILTGTKNCTNSCKVIKVKTFCMTFLIHQNEIFIFVQFWKTFVEYFSNIYRQENIWISLLLEVIHQNLFFYKLGIVACFFQVKMLLNGLLIRG